MTPVRAARPRFDPELAPVVEAVPPTELTAATLPALRAVAATPPGTVDARLAELAVRCPVERRDVHDVAPDGEPVELSVLRPAGRTPGVLAPAVLWLHGGGMVMGDRFSQLDVPLEWLERFGAVVVTVDYRLAPEHPAPVPVEDGYRGLCWLADHAAELGVDPARLVVAGISAGGGVAAGVTLLARDRGGPAVAAQVLSCPMLDHRNDTPSSHQYAGGPATWTREQNAFGWAALLSGSGAAVSPYASPAVAEDLSGLPPTFVDVGSAEVFRDEDVRYASRIWAAGGDAELHVWPGGFHAFDVAVPAARVSVAARSARTAWLARALAAA